MRSFLCFLLLATPALAREPSRSLPRQEQPSVQKDTRGHIIGRTKPLPQGNGWRSYDERGHVTGQFERMPDGSVRAYDERHHYLGRVVPANPRRPH